MTKFSKDNPLQVEAKTKHGKGVFFVHDLVANIQRTVDSKIKGIEFPETPIELFDKYTQEEVDNFLGGKVDLETLKDYVRIKAFSEIMDAVHVRIDSAEIDIEAGRDKRIEFALSMTGISNVIAQLQVDNEQAHKDIVAKIPTGVALKSELETKILKIKNQILNEVNKKIKQIEKSSGGGGGVSLGVRRSQINNFPTVTSIDDGDLVPFTDIDDEDKPKNITYADFIADFGLSGLSNNALLRADGPNGIQDSGWILDDSDNLTGEGDLTLDNTSTTALQVRKNGDTGDVLTVDTVNNKVTIEGGATGDADIEWQISDVTKFFSGVDDSDGDKWKLSGSGGFSVDDYITVSTVDIVLDLLLDTRGGRVKAYRKVTDANITSLAKDELVEAKITTGVTKTVTLIDPTTLTAGHTFYFKNQHDSAGGSLIDFSRGIDGAAIGATTIGPGAGIAIYSDGSEYMIHP